MLKTESPLQIEIGEKTIDTDMNERTTIATVRLADTVIAAALMPGDKFRLIPGDNPASLSVAAPAAATV